MRARDSERATARGFVRMAESPRRRYLHVAICLQDQCSNDPPAPYKYRERSSS